MTNTEGVGYYGRGDYDRALDAFQTAARLNPDDSGVYYNIASTYQQQAVQSNQPALLSQAEIYYQKCLEKNPSPETTVCCYRGLATSMNQRQANDEALALLQGWETRNPTSIEPRLEIAYLLEAQGKNTEAIDALEKITAADPNDYRAFYKLGAIREKLGQDVAAMERYKMAQRLRPADPEIAQRIATLEAKQLAATAVAASATPQAPPTHASAPPMGTAVGWQNAAASVPNISVVPPNPDTTAPISQTGAVNPAPPSYAHAPAGTFAAVSPPLQNPADVAPSLPDGNGANPFAMTTPPPLTAPGSMAPPLSDQTASVAPVPPDSTTFPRSKSRIGEMQNGPPRTSAGAPF